MVGVRQNPSTEQAQSREALAAAIGDAARRVLAGYDDDQLLGQPQAQLVSRVRRAVRSVLQASHLELLSRRSARTTSRALDEVVTNEVRKRQFAAFERQLATVYGPLPDTDALAATIDSRTINGVTVIAVTAPAADTANQDKAWSADD